MFSAEQLNFTFTIWFGENDSPNVELPLVSQNIIFWPLATPNNQKRFTLYRYLLII